MKICVADHRPNGTGVVEDLTDGSALPHGACKVMGIRVGRYGGWYG